MPALGDPTPGQAPTVDAVHSPHRVTFVAEEAAPEAEAEAEAIALARQDVPVPAPSPAAAAVDERAPDSEADFLAVDVQKTRAAFKRFAPSGAEALDVSAFGRLLREELGMHLTQKDATRAVDLVCPGRGAVDFQSLRGLLQRCHEAEEEEAERSARQAYSAEELETLRGVFRAFDSNNTGLLEVDECSKLLEARGRIPRTKEESLRLGALLASARGGRPGPLNFKEFLTLARWIDDEDGVHERKAEVAARALSRWFEECEEAPPDSSGGGGLRDTLQSSE